MSMEVANTILAQLGGRQFLAMTGAKHLIGSANSLSLQLPNANCAGRKVSGIRVILEPSDTYTVEALYIRGSNRTVVKTVSDVYCDNLQQVFTSLTGLYTRL